MSEITDEEIDEWSVELLEKLNEMEEAISELQPQVKAVREGELAYGEYLDWIDNNADMLKALQF